MPARTGEKYLLRMTDLTVFINKVEDVVDTELETLRTHILKNTDKKTMSIDLAQFYDYVYLWAESVW